MNSVRILVLLLILLLSLVGKAQLLLHGTGSFSYNGYGPLRTQPVKVFYHIPKGNPKQMPILMALHGDERDGKAYLDDWVSAADKHGFMVFAPEFAENLYGGGNGYNLANMYADGDQPSANTARPDSLWTFAVLDPLFNYIKQSTVARATGYVAFGHSAGAQLLHRFVLYKPNSLLQKAICANAGWYTLPNIAIAFPYGAGASPFVDSMAKKAFAKNMLVLLGKQDNNANSPGLRHSPEADAQGTTRLARGRYFYTKSRAIANAMPTPYNWTMAEVAGVGHNHTLMAANALQHVLVAFGPPTNTPATPIDAFWTDEGISLAGLNAEEVFSIKIYAIEGKLLYASTGIFPANQTIAYRPKPTGVYLLQIKTAAHGQLSKRIFCSP